MLGSPLRRHRLRDGKDHVARPAATQSTRVDRMTGERHHHASTSAAPWFNKRRTLASDGPTPTSRCAQGRGRWALMVSSAPEQFVHAEAVGWVAAPRRGVPLLVTSLGSGLAPAC